MTKKKPKKEKIEENNDTLDNLMNEASLGGDAPGTETEPGPETEEEKPEPKPGTEPHPNLTATAVTNMNEIPPEFDLSPDGPAPEKAEPKAADGVFKDDNQKDPAEAPKTEVPLVYLEVMLELFKEACMM